MRGSRVIPYFPRHWYVGVLIVVVLASSLGIQAMHPASVKAAPASWLGVDVYVPTGIHGSWGTIGTTRPDVPVSGDASFEFIMTYNRDANGVQHFVQIGWTRQDACGPNTTVFWEWFDGTTYSTQLPIANKCAVHFPTGDHDYATQYDSSTGYWCFNFGATCIKSVPYTDPELTTAYFVAAYGETTDLSVQMGGNSQANAIYLTNLRYFDANTHNPVYITNANNVSPYGGCGSVVQCPYGWGMNYAASVLYTYNWTNP